MNTADQAPRYKVLVVEDNSADSDLVRESLMEIPDHPVEVVVMGRLDRALEALDHHAFSAVLLDLNLPDSTGFDTFLRLRGHARDVSIIVLTGREDEELALEMVRAGAQDYLVKGRVPGAALLRALRYATERQSSINELEVHRRDVAAAYANLAKLLDASADGVLVVDQTDIVRLANPAAAALLGCAQQDLIGAGLPLPADPHVTPEMVLESSRGPTPIVEARVVDMELNAAPVSLITLRDITERKQMERRLAQAQKMEAVGQLTGGIAHDFNNLLTVIVGSLSVVRQRLNGDDLLHKLVDSAYDAGNRGAELVRGLLAFSRIQRLKADNHDLNEIVEESVKLLDRTLDESVAIRVIPGAQSGRVLCDRAQLQSALLNLAINARDAMPNGGSLTIETSNTALDTAYAATREEVAPGPYVQLTVRDTGTGMPSDVAGRAFEPFFTTKEVGDGSGLGLSMVHGFVKQSGGHVEIDSAPGQGTAVKLFFPQTLAVAEKPVEPAPQNLVSKGNETILVVEDDPRVREVSVAMLLDLGYRVLQAESGASALRLLKHHPEVALVFSDVVMPGGMTGVDLVRRIRNRHPDMKTLLTSGYARDAMSRQDDLEDDIEVLPKPFDGARLARSIRAALDA